MAQSISPSRLLPIPTTTTHHHHHLFSSLTSATSLTDLKQIHAQILRSGHDCSNSLLLKLALSSSSLDYALSVFSTMHLPEPHLCNKFLREVSRSDGAGKTLLVYDKMRRQGFHIDRFSLPPLLKASARACALTEGKEIHGLASKFGFDTDPFVQTALIGMYAACGQIQAARLVFDKMPHRDIVTWNTMIDSYCQLGLFDEVLPLLEEMRSSNIQPDERMFSTIISACGRAENIHDGKSIHEYLIKNHIEIDPHLQTSLITMYSSCGSMDEAQNLYNDLSPKNLVASTTMLSGYSKLGDLKSSRLIFDRMAEKDLICWSAMIGGYAESDQPQEALNLFDEMRKLGIKPDQVTFLIVISACANLGSLHQADQIHKLVYKNGFAKALPVNNALIDMYAKCGSLEKANQVFRKMRLKNVISWTSMISSFAVHGDAHEALNLFREMRDENIEPNWVTFLGILYACSHAGLVKEGRKMFESMVKDHKIEPKLEHYGCLADLYGRANMLTKALEVVENMPFPPNVVIWGSLMASCRIHNEFELGEFAAKQVLRLNPNHDGAHVFLSNIYAKEQKWEKVGELRKSMRDMGIYKEKGYSRIELNDEMHEFLAADKNHEEADEIYAKLEDVVGELKKVGYAPDVCNSSVDLDEEEKEKAVLWHSEKLALCYGLMRGKRGGCVRIVKNLRICEDCHRFMKFASMVYGREIVVRDRSRFHHYRDGACSCKDYW